MTSGQECVYVIFDGATITVVSGAPSVPADGAPLFLGSRGRKTSCQATEISIGKFAQSAEGKAGGEQLGAKNGVFSMISSV